MRRKMPSQKVTVVDGIDCSIKNYLMSTSASVSTSSGSLDYQHDAGAFGKMVESGQIGFRLAEEIKSLREELLSLKQEKRILLVSNENLEDSLLNANNTISALHTKLVELQNHVNYTASELTSKVTHHTNLCTLESATLPHTLAHDTFQ